MPHGPINELSGNQRRKTWHAASVGKLNVSKTYRHTASIARVERSGARHSLPQWAMWRLALRSTRPTTASDLFRKFLDGQNPEIRAAEAGEGGDLSALPVVERSSSHAR